MNSSFKPALCKPDTATCNKFSNLWLSSRIESSLGTRPSKLNGKLNYTTDVGLFVVRFSVFMHKNGAIAPVDYLPTFATAPINYFIIILFIIFLIINIKK